MDSNTRRCRYCGRLFSLNNPKDERPGGRQPMYCSEECRQKWRREYALKLKWKNIEQKRKADIEYHRRIREDRQKNGTFFLYNKVDWLIQKIMNLELYDFQLQNYRFKVPYTEIRRKQIDPIRLESNLLKIERLHLSTEYLLTHETYEQSDYDFVDY